MAVIVVWVCEVVKVWLSAVVCCCFTDGRVSDFGDLGFWPLLRVRDAILLKSSSVMLLC